MRKYIAQIHLILGLGIGFLFFITAFSGALYTWEPEFSYITYHQKVRKEDRPFISVSTIKKTLNEAFPEGDFRTALYRDSERAIEVLLYVPGTYYHAYLNPYSGELIHLQDMNKGWINYLKKLHRNFLLGPLGREIVHWVTLTALIMLISGLVIWWPSKGISGKQRFLIQWTASPKKLNYDLHLILGFYSFWILIFTVGTGIFWGFSSVRETLKEVSGENEKSWDLPNSIPGSSNPEIAHDEVFNRLIQDYRSKFPDSEVRISIPHQSDEAVHLSIIKPHKGINAVDHFYHDQFTGGLLSGNFQNGLARDRSTFSKINGLVYEIHLGSVWGLPGRILAFLGSLIAASLPITGLLLWLHKRNRK